MNHRLDPKIEHLLDLAEKELQKTYEINCSYNGAMLYSIRSLAASNLCIAMQRERERLI